MTLFGHYQCVFFPKITFLRLKGFELRTELERKCLSKTNFARKHNFLLLKALESDLKVQKKFKLHIVDLSECHVLFEWPLKTK